MVRMPATEAKDRISEVISRAEFAGERTILQRRGKDAAAVIPMRELELFEELLERFEDQVLGEAALAVLRDPERSKTVSLEEVLRKAGLTEDELRG